MNSNMNLQIVLDYFAVLTYVLEYYSKDGRYTYSKVSEGGTEEGNHNNKEKMHF